MTNFLNTRILLSGATILASAVVIVGATLAFFSDVETSEANAFTAGDVQVAISDLEHVYTGGGLAEDQPTFDPDGFSFELTDIKPLDSGEVSYVLSNQANDAQVCAMVEEDGNTENGRNDSEEEAGDTTAGNPGAGNGELQNFMSFDFGGSQGLLSDIDGDWFSVGTVNNGETGEFEIGYCFGEYDSGDNCIANSTGDVNVAQTDGMTADISFYAVQTRNNETFDCATLNTPEPEDQLVGAALGAYVVPACTVTVTGASSIQSAIDSASTGDTVCVDDTYDATGDNSAIRIETAGVTLAATVRGVDLDVPVTLSASNVTVTGFDGVIGQAATPAEQAAFYVEGDADGFEISFNTVNGGTGAGILTETGGALGGGLIANNTLSGATQGIYTNPHTGVFTIEYNDIDDNVAGIGGLMGAIVRNNEFEHSGAAQEAIGVDSTNDSNPATVNFNNFLDDTRVNTYGPIAGDLSAENNFWGPNGGANQTGGTDEVDFDPEAVSAFSHQ